VLVRGVGILLALGTGGLVAAGAVTSVLDLSPTVDVVLVALNGSGGEWRYWLGGTATILVAGLIATGLGARIAHAVARRPSLQELHSESHPVAPRPTPRSQLTALIRTDRASVWRSVPLRRGCIVLALLPGSVAAAGRLDWDTLPLLPGIVAAGGALLFGVNAWCLDGTGARWRDSLPVRPELAFAARAAVLTEVLLVTALLTLFIAGVRADGLPARAELASPLAAVVVVSLQVVARAMHWSQRRPFATDLRSARAAPAPPLAMVTYSAYLALTSTMTGLLFSLTARAGDETAAVLVAVPLLLLAVRRLVITAREWGSPAVRAAVVATVSVR
jgi:hypothetical protein